MATLHLSPATRIEPRTRKARKQSKTSVAAVSADKVREMLREIAFVLHATRVVRQMSDTPQEG